MTHHQLARAATLTAYFALLGAIFYSVWVFGPDDTAARLVLWLITVSGLLLVLPGLLKDWRRSYQWLCFILLLYFIWFVQAVFAKSAVNEPSAAIDEIVALCLVVFTFVASMLAARWWR